ncbi:Macrolide export ATP-binding/permease protein MacB [compost metagenome]
MKISLKVVAIDYDFIPTYGIGVVAGRNFSREHSTDTTNFMLNETAVSKLGWGAPQNAIGKDIMYGGVRGKVIGVAKDFHFESMHEKIVPLIMSLPPERINAYGRLSVKIKGNNIQAAIAEVETKWHKYLPETPFEYTFLNERFDRLYKSEQQQGKVFTIFACIAVFIACLGLFGLSAFAISQRIKEIGIRKVLGASIPEIVKVLSVDFLKLVIIAAVIAFPVAWYVMHQWLQDFAYRVSIQWWVLAISGIAAILIALITISFQSIKAAMANPVKSLRSE